MHESALHSRVMAFPRLRNVILNVKSTNSRACERKVLIKSRDPGYNGNPTRRLDRIWIWAPRKFSIISSSEILRERTVRKQNVIENFITVRPTVIIFRNIIIRNAIARSDVHYYSFLKRRDENKQLAQA